MVILSLALCLCHSASYALVDYAIIDRIVYALDFEELEAKVLNFQTNSSIVTIPSHVYYRGDEYKVIGLSYNAFNKTAYDNYKEYISYNNIFGGNALGELIAESAYERAEAQRVKEEGFQYDYEYTRSMITTLNLPNTLIYIGENAFNGMIRIKSLTIPASVKYLPGRREYLTNTRLPRLEEITILGLPTYQEFGGDYLSLKVVNDKGEYIYNYKVLEKFNISNCPNIQSFNMPEFDKILPLMNALKTANDELSRETKYLNLLLSRLEITDTITTPILEDSVFIDEQTIKTAYNHAYSFLKHYEEYITLYDSLTTNLKKHAYYDNSQLSFEITEHSFNNSDASQTENMRLEFNKMESNLKTEYEELVNGKMENNLKITNLTKYIAGYLSLNPHKKSAIDSIYLDYRCENKVIQYRYVLQYIEEGHITTKTCRKKQWEKYGYLFDSFDEFNTAYNNATSNDFFTEFIISNRTKAYNKLNILKEKASKYSKDIKIANMHKKPTEVTSDIIKILDALKISYYYDKAVSHLIHELPKVKQEYDKNGKYFKDEIDFFEAYSSDSYKKQLKEKKK